MSDNRSRGFTLIELLVVIAIIGLLSAVVLASLNSARTKGADAAVKSQLKNTQAQAEIVYDSVSPNSYANVCTDPTVQTQVTAAGTAGGASTYAWTSTSIPSATATACHSALNTYVIEVPLKSGGYWCIDSTGNSKQTANAIASGATVCP